MQSQLPHSAPQGIGINSKEPCGTVRSKNFPIGQAQCHMDMLGHGFVQGEYRAVSIRQLTGPLPTFRPLEMLKSQHAVPVWVSIPYQFTLDEVFEFPDITRPVIGPESVQCPR